VRFGYGSFTCQQDSLLARAGEVLRGHEFHYWESDCSGLAFRAHKPGRQQAWDCIVADDSLHAGFPHFHLCAAPQAAARFVAACREFGERR